MPMIYDAVHNTIKHVEDDDDVIQDGKVVRVPMMLMDSMQQSVALEDARRNCAEDRALYNLDISNRWRGGISAVEAGDTVKIGDRTRVVVSHEDGKLVLRDATSADGNALKQAAYDSYDQEIQSRYLTTNDAVAGEACLTAGREKGVWRERAKDGRMVCVPVGDKSSKEHEIAGPLSDAKRAQVMDEAYTSYDDQVSNAWRR